MPSCGTVGQTGRTALPEWVPFSSSEQRAEGTYIHSHCAVCVLYILYILYSTKQSLACMRDCKTSRPRKSKPETQLRGSGPCRPGLACRWLYVYVAVGVDAGWGSPPVFQDTPGLRRRPSSTAPTLGREAGGIAAWSGRRRSPGGEW